MAAEIEGVDIEDEHKRILSIPAPYFATTADVSSGKWEELATHSFLRLSIFKETDEQQLKGFMTELLSRRSEPKLVAMKLRCLNVSDDLERHKSLINCLMHTIPPTTRVYLQ